MLLTDETNLESLPSVPCREDDWVKDGFVFSLSGELLGSHNPALDVLNVKKEILVESWSEFVTQKFPENRWLIHDLVPAGGFVILAAPSGEKKTWIAMAMAKAIATGEDFLSHFKTVKGSVLYLNGEMAKTDIQSRGKLLNFGKLDNLWLVNQEIDFYSFKREEGDESDNSDNRSENIKWLFKQIIENDIKAVFVDTFRAYAGGIQEEKAELIRGYMNQFKPLKDLGVAVIFLDHTRKPARFDGQTPKKEQLFASQDKVANCEIVIMLKSNPGSDEVFVYQVKNRLGKEIEGFQLNLESAVDEQKVDSITLVYKGEFMQKEYKQEQAEDVVLGALEDGTKGTKALLDLLKIQSIGERNGREAIRGLVNKGLILQPYKLGREHFYELPTKEKDDLEIESLALI